MTVGSDVKSCYLAIKSAQASLQQLHEKSRSKEAKIAFDKATHLLSDVKDDLHTHVLFLAREEPQYK